MKAFTLTRILLSLLFSLSILACTDGGEEAELLSGSGHRFQICNKTSYSTRLLERYQEGDEDYVSLWITVGPHSCTPVSYRQTHSQYYIQSEAGRYIPGAGEPAYDHSNEGIVCWDRRMLFFQKAEYNYNGHDVFLSGTCPSGMDRKPVASLKWNIEAVGDQTLIYTALISTGKFDYNDRIDGRKFVDFSISELDRIKQEIADTEAQIERVKKGLRECSQQISHWQKQKIFALNTDEITQADSCGDAPQRESIKKTIDAAKEKTRQLLLAFLDSASGFFARALAQVDSVLSEAFGFDEGALSSFLGVNGSSWSTQPTAAVVPALNQALDSSYGRDHKEFLQTAHDGLLIMVEQGRRILGQPDDEEVAFAYLKQATAVRDNLENKDFAKVEEDDPDSPKAKLKAARSQISENRDSVRATYSGSDRSVREGILDVADSTVDSAEDSYKSGEDTEADWKLDTAKRLADLAISSTPYLGSLYSLASVAIGKNLITGDSISGEEGTLMAAEAIIGVMSGGIGGTVRGTGKVAKIIKDIAKRTAKKASREAIDLKREQQIDTSVDKGMQGATVANSSASVFEKQISKMPQGEREAFIKPVLAAKAAQQGWTKDNKVSTKNNRRVYKDKDGYYWAEDTQHGRYEKCNSKGKHLGEFNIDLRSIDDSIDSSGGHDLIL